MDSRWPPERLDAEFKRIHDRLVVVEDVTVRLTRVEGKLEELVGDTHEIKLAMQQRDRDREEERKERIKDRRSNIQWMVGTAIATAAIVVAAVGVLQGFVG